MNVCGSYGSRQEAKGVQKGWGTFYSYKYEYGTVVANFMILIAYCTSTRTSNDKSTVRVAVTSFATVR